jgi:phosphogluconate dehydratase
MNLTTTSPIDPRLQAITDALRLRSKASRLRYLQRMAAQQSDSRARLRLSAPNQAHGYAALGANDKIAIATAPVPMLGIVSAYNDVLSAHEPMQNYPAIIRDEARKHAAVAQFAGGVPAMCDGVTQGFPGMDISLFSRDVIAMSTAVALTHDLYDGVLLLGVCDKIVPGLLVGALSFGHLPMIFVPAGPMPTGISNSAKSQVRKQHAQGKVTADALLASEMAAYHSAGTCTFYGTANSNQALLEAMGLMLPGAAFVAPNDPRRELLTRAATAAIAKSVAQVGRVNSASDDLHVSPLKPAALGSLVNAESIVNAIVLLLATGGSTNHTMHWVAIARAAGIDLTWQDISDLSQIIPSLTRVYPNGEADVNQFDAAGGLALVMRELLDAGLMHDNVNTVAGAGLRRYTLRLAEENHRLRYQPAPAQALDPTIISTVAAPFQTEGGLRLMQGNLGKAVVKVSAVAPEHRVVSAPARVFASQEEALLAFKNNQLNQHCVVVVVGQGPKARGMPELHKLTPALAVLQDRGFQVALVTDGRMSGASGRIPAAIHVTPEAAADGPIGKLRDGDLLTIDCNLGHLNVHADASQWQDRASYRLNSPTEGFGRELFAVFRNRVSSADSGACAIGENW